MRPLSLAGPSLPGVPSQNTEGVCACAALQFLHSQRGSRARRPAAGEDEVSIEMQRKEAAVSARGRVRFPDSFIWGAATAAHQVEGNNVNSDWWDSEVREGSTLSSPSGDAADSYHRYREDIDLVAESGLGAYRFSIEWARVEPVEGTFSKAELDHYRRMVAHCVDRDVQPIVTLNHFTLPLWLRRRGGWLAQRAPRLFERYVQRLVPSLAGNVEFAVTINEPNVLVAMERKAQGDSEWASEPALTAALIDAHQRAVRILRLAGIQAGWSVASQQFGSQFAGEGALLEGACPGGNVFLEAARSDDFIGVQAYAALRPAEGMASGEDFAVQEEGSRAIAEAARWAWEASRVPVFVTDNGLASDDDLRRVEFTGHALLHLHRVIDAGLPLVGYLHWSLLDGHGWFSREPTAGLVHVDRTTFARTPRPSLAWLGAVARNGGF